MSKRLIALLAGAMAIALIAAGCGGSSNNNEEEGTPTTGSLTKAEFVKKGNEICKKGNAAVEAGIEKFVKENGISNKQPPSKAQSAEAAETVLIPTIRNDVEEIRALGLPKDDPQGAEEVLHAAEEALKKGEEDPVALIESEGEPAAFKKVNRLSREYGLTVCGEEEG